MQLLRELLGLGGPTDALEASQHLPRDKYAFATEEVDAVADGQVRDDYVDLPKAANSGKKKRKSFPLSDRAENSLINTIWYYQNADAS